MPARRRWPLERELTLSAHVGPLMPEPTQGLVWGLIWVVLNTAWLPVVNWVESLPCSGEAQERRVTTPAGPVQWCETADGSRDGPHRAQYPGGGTRESGAYARGEREGLWTGYYADGSRQWEVIYAGGEAHGPVLRWHPGGTRALVGMCREGRAEGFWIRWTAEGIVDAEAEFRRGRMVWGRTGDPALPPLMRHFSECVTHEPRLASADQAAH